MAGPRKPLERVPRYPGPVGWSPANSTPHRVKDGETWESVASKYNIDVKKLIWFNYHTDNTDEVNWYLRHRVGCTKPSPSGFNYMFSSDAEPGLIYIPVERFNMEPYETKANKSKSPFAIEFESPAAPLDTIGKAFDIFQMLDIGLAILGATTGEAIVLGVGIVTAPIAPFVLMGGMHEAALNELRKKQIAEGMSLGIVLGADNRSNRYVLDHGYFKMNPVENRDYPKYGKQLQGIYNTSLISGLAHGRSFNSVGKVNLFKFIQRRLMQNGNNDFPPDSKTWNSRTWDLYYRLGAAVLREKLSFN